MNPRRTLLRWMGSYPVSALVCLALLAVRSWARVQRPELWAEDGAVFLPEALSHGFGALAIPYGGYYDTVQRLILWALLELFPVAWLPWGILMACLSIYALVMAQWVRPEYEWLIPSRAVRVVIPVLAALAPGLTEITGNLCNLMWVLFFALAFQGLKDPVYRYRFWELAMAALIVASIGSVVLLIPLFLWRLVVLVRAHAGRHLVVLNGCLLGMLVVGTLWLIVVRDPEFSQMPQESSVVMVRTLVNTTYDNAVYRPWFGDRLAATLLDGGRTYAEWGVKLAFLAVGIYLVLPQWRKPHAQALVVFGGAVILWPVLSWAARPGNMFAFQVHVPEWFLRHRYSFPVAVAATVCWLGFLRPLPHLTRVRAAATALFVMVGLVGGTSRFWIGTYGPEKRWERTAPLLDRYLKTGCPHHIDTPVYPDGWALQFDAPDQSVTCQDRN